MKPTLLIIQGLEGTIPGLSYLSTLNIKRKSLWEKLQSLQTGPP